MVLICFHNFSERFFSQFLNFSQVANLVFKSCSIWVFKLKLFFLKFCHNLSFWVLSLLEFWVLAQLYNLNLVNIYFFHNFCLFSIFFVLFSFLWYICWVTKYFSFQIIFLKVTGNINFKKKSNFFFFFVLQNVGYYCHYCHYYH